MTLEQPAALPQGAKSSGGLAGQMMEKPADTRPFSLLFAP